VESGKVERVKELSVRRTYAHPAPQPAQTSGSVTTDLRQRSYSCTKRVSVSGKHPPLSCVKSLHGMQEVLTFACDEPPAANEESPLPYVRT